MPTYQYACQACDEQFEVVQSFSDDSLTAHEPGCGGPVRKVFGSVGVVFKGSGFYRTDSRSRSGKESGTAAGKDTKAESTTASAPKSESTSGSSDSGAKGSSGGSSKPASTGNTAAA